VIETTGPLARLLEAALIAAALFGGYRLVTALVLSRARRTARGLSLFTPGLPAVLFFTTPDCVTCKAAQKPALRAVQDRLKGMLQVIEVDALDSPRLAREWSVLSVPTTFILDRDGRPLQVNHGYASTEKLIAQLRPCIISGS
jgi:thiol-disulfide isomerase/thioredoxin